MTISPYQAGCLAIIAAVLAATAYAIWQSFKGS